MTDLELAIQALEQIAAAAHFDAQTYEDYTLPMRVYDLYVQAMTLAEFVKQHPEHTAELSALARTVAAQP